MSLELKNLISHPLLWFGILARSMLIFGFEQVAFFEWYGPFLRTSLLDFSLDPWFEWLATGGDQASFPYGYVMWASLFPFQVSFLGFGQAGTVVAYFAALFCFDFLLLLLLIRLVPGRIKFLLVSYWLSPIILISVYVLGLNDVIPAFFLVLAIILIREQKFGWAGMVVGASISAKLSMIVSLPLFVIFLIKPKYRATFPRFLGGLAAITAVTWTPFLLSESARIMLFGNPELQKVFALTLDSGQDVAILVVPLLYALLVYSIWRVNRLNLDMFQVAIGVAFLVVVLTTPSFGWFLWVLPFLVLYQARGGKTGILMVWIFSLVYVASSFTTAPVMLSGGRELWVFGDFEFDGARDFFLGSVLHTFAVAVGIILGARMWRETVMKSDYFRAGRAPFVIGIAGDSGAGKDSLAEGLAGVLGTSSVARISGDDYHLWDRQKPMWQVMTHLNPAANDLEKFWRDLSSLVDRRSIMVSHYDHGTGKADPPVKVRSRDFIVCSGLHALSLPALLRLYDLKIYLDIDESLRRYFKTRRDTETRGHSVLQVAQAIEKRMPDSQKFIQPQAAAADLIFSLQPIHPIVEGEAPYPHDPRLRLIVRVRDETQIASLRRALVGVAGLGVDFSQGSGEQFSDLSVEGDISSADIAQAAQILCPHMSDYLSLSPEWLAGTLGLMQLIVVQHMNLALSRKLFR